MSKTYKKNNTDSHHYNEPFNRNKNKFNLNTYINYVNNSNTSTSYEDEYYDHYYDEDDYYDKYVN